MLDHTNDPTLAFQFYMEHEEPAFYSRVPGILYHLTYLVKENGETVRKRLSPRARDFYVYVKQLAGVSHRFWLNRNQIADALGCSTGIITEIKKELCQSFEQLNGKPLIEIEKKKKRYMKDGKNETTTYDQICLKDIWKENNTFMGVMVASKRSGLKFEESQPIEDVHNLEAESKNDSAEKRSQKMTLPSGGAESQNDRLVTVTEEDQSCKLTDNPADAESVCNPSKGTSVNSVKDEAQKEIEHTRQQLMNFGCDNNFINEVLKKYSPQRIINAGVYTREQMKRKKLNNKFGYLRNAIENKREWKNVS